MGADLAALVAARAPGEDADPEALLAAAEEIGAALAAELAGPVGDVAVEPLPLRDIAPPSAGERAVAIERALAWARSAGASWDGIEPALDADGNASMRASRALVAGEAIARVPRSSMVLSPASDRPPRDVLAAWLAREVKDPASRWAAYLATLPVQLAELPMFHAAAELAGTAAYALVADDQRGVRQAYAALAAEERAHISLADFAWGCAIVQSRGFHAPGSVTHRIALVPVIDLFDHRLGDTTWSFEPADGLFVVSTERAFAAGEPVGFPYGEHGNTQLHVRYGFVEPGNLAPEAALVFARAQDAVAAVAAHLLWGVPLDAPARVRVGARIDHRFVRALSLARLQAAAPEDRARAIAAGLDAAGDLPWLGTALERRAFGVIEVAAQHSLAALDAHLSPAGSAAALVRDDERGVVHAILAATRRIQAELADPDPARLRSVADALAEDAIGAVVRPYLRAIADAVISDPPPDA